MSNILKGLNENRSSWDSNMPGYQGDYGGEDNWGRRNKASDENEKIDAMLRQQNAQRQEYIQSGKFWLKLKDSQRHLPAGPFIGKQAANQAAIDLLKKQPDLKGNLLITAYGPDEKQDVSEAEQVDSPKFQSAVSALKQMAKQGERQTVWDPVKRVYKTVPIAQSKEVKEENLSEEELDENLRKWFKEKWVRFGPDGKIRGACARGDDSEGKPKCLPQSKAHSLGKKGRKYAASKKRREDPNPERRGPAKNVATKKKSNEDVAEGYPGYAEKGKELAVATKKIQADLDKRIRGKEGSYDYVKRGKELSAATKKIQSNLDKRIAKLAEQGVAEGSLNEFAPDGFNGGDDDEGFSPEIAKMAQEDGFTKGVGLADGATLERAITINHWHNQHGGMYKQYFAKGFKAGRMNKIKHDNRQYNLNLKLMKDGSIRHGGLNEYGDTAKGQKMLGKVHNRAADKVTSKQADKDPAYARKAQQTQDRAWDRLAVKEQGVAEGLSKGNYNVGLEDIGKPVTVDGESGYVLLSIGYSSGNGKLTAHILQPDSGSKGTYDLETIGKGQQGVAEEQLDELKCWPGYTRVQGVPAGAPGSCKKKTNEEVSEKVNPETVRRLQQMLNKKFNANLDVDGVLGPLTIKSIKKFLPKASEKKAPNPERTTAVQGSELKEEKCPECGGPMFSDLILAEKKDACYHKVRSRYKVWPSAYASGALVQCRKKGAANWGTGGKKNESVEEGYLSNPGQEDSPVVSAITRRILMQRTDLLATYGPEYVTQAIDDVADGVGEVEEIGSSDVSGWVKQVENNLKNTNIEEGQIYSGGNKPAGMRWYKPRTVPNQDQLSKKESAIMKGLQLEGNDEEYHTGGTLGTPYPGTYEEETLPYRTKGQKRTLPIAFEDEQLDEKWSEKYKSSIDCNNPKGFSQKAHCQGKKK